ncbi:MAG: polyprenyl diphosphate synthase, partial [Candidatus Gracilibacteria bacterium]
MEKVPHHIAIIPDGNRRWARAKGLLPYEGHREGAKRVHEIAEIGFERGVKYMTVWGTSADNLKKRSKTEVSFLVKLFEKELKEILNSETLRKNEIRMRVIGRGKEIVKSKVLSKLIEDAERDTAHFHKGNLTILFGYDGKEEMIEAFQKGSKLHTSKFNYESIKEFLWTKDLPSVDFVIRTGGEPHWSSGFMMWH